MRLTLNMPSRSPERYAQSRRLAFADAAFRRMYALQKLIEIELVLY